MKQIDLWPPLSQIQREIEGDPMPIEDSLEGGDRPVVCNAVLARAPGGLAGALQPVRDWTARRRNAEGLLGASTWAQGMLVGVTCGRVLHGLLLDRCLGDERWVGWMAAPECDWAGAFDVLLEPEDEPFDPMCGLIQTWNTVTLSAGSGAAVPLLGRLSMQRLAAVRAVQGEYQSSREVMVPAELGRIALRVVNGAFTVLTGAPLLPQDPRQDYKAIYRRAGSRLSGAMGA